VLDQRHSIAEASRSLDVGENAFTPKSKALTLEQQRIQELEARCERPERAIQGSPIDEWAGADLQTVRSTRLQTPEIQYFLWLSNGPVNLLVDIKLESFCPS
jgi:hypothetical protein